MSTRKSPKGNTPPNSANIVRANSSRSINDGVFGVKVRDTPFNPLIQLDLVKRNMSLFFEHESLTRNSGYFKFKGLLNDRHLIPFNINRMLYSRGGLVAFNYHNRKEILPFVISGTNGLNYYGLPFMIRPVPYAQEVRLLLDIELTVGKDCAIWLDTIPFQASYTPTTRRDYNTIINNEKTEALVRVKMSMVAHFEKHIIRVESPQQADKLRASFRTALENADPVVIVSEYFEIQKGIFGGMSYMGGEFFATLKDYSALQDSYNGISTSGYGIEKAERLVAGELSGIGEQVDIMADLRRRMAKRFARECRELLGWTNFDIETAHYNQEERAQSKQEIDGSEPSVGGIENV
jgi:hypothetical protein